MIRSSPKALPRPWRLLALLIVGTLAALPPTARAERPLPPKVHAERHSFDKQTGQWVRTPNPVPGTEDGDLDLARQSLAREEYSKALKQAENWIKTYGPLSPRYPEALYVKATAALGAGDYRAAHDTYESILNDYPGSEYAEQALSSQFRIAEQYLAGKRRKAWKGLIRVTDRDGGLEIMNDLIANYADTPLAELAQMTKADYHFGRGEFDLAEEEYAVFARDYARSRWHSRALLRSAQAALASFPGVKFDDAALREAEARFQQFGKLYPALAEQHDVPVLLEQIAARQADKTLEIARFYEKTGKTKAARYYYRQTVTRWPNTAAAAQAQARLASLGEWVPFPQHQDQTVGYISPSPEGQ